MDNGKKKVLIIEDEEHTLSMLQQYLGFHDFATDGALTGMIGLQKVNTFKPDLLLLDLMLPDMDGLVILKLLRGRDETENLPVIILSALGTPSSVRQGYEAGATRYLKKPIDLDKLVKEIGAALEAGEHVEPSDELKAADIGEEPPKGIEYHSDDVDILITSKKAKGDGDDTIRIEDDK